MNKLLFFVAFLISYGSLYPFSFDIAAIDSDRLQLFIGNWDGLTKTGNTLSNIALFIPFGIVGMLAFLQQNISRRFLVVMIMSFVLGLLLQVLQLFIPQRIPAVYDVIWNLAGTGLGALVSVAFVSYLPVKLKQENVLSVPVILIGCWLAYRLMPFIPSIDWQLVKTSLKPLLLQPSFSLVDCLQDIAGWLVVAFIWPREFMPRICKYNIAILILPVFIMEIFFVDNVLTLSNVIGAVFAVFIWWGILSRSRDKDILLVILLLVVIFLQGLSPFAVREHYAAFQWLPFSGFLTGSMLVNTQVLFGKLFFYGSLIWVISRRSSNIALATVFTAIWVFMIEIGQIFFSNHTPEITDLLIAVLTGIGIHYYHIKYRCLSERQSTQQQEDKNLVGQSYTNRAIESKSAAFPLKGQIYAALKTPVILLLLGWVGPAIIIYMVLRMPGIPYNVRELFHGGLFDIGIFSFALLWIGISAAYAGDRISSSPRSYITIPRLVFTTSIISYWLLSNSVTTESISDILGSANMLWQVKEKKIWGDIGAIIFSVIDWPAGIEFFERIIRYLALYSPLVFMLAIFSATANDLTRKPGMPVFRKLLFYVSFSLPWLVLCKVIAFDYYSTDNLIELIARPGKYGLGGGGYLYLLLVIITAVSTFIAWSGRITLKWKITAALSFAVSVPVGWWLLNKGLVTNFTKYNTTFSGVDFLLGPDRKHKLPQTVLFLRWSVLQTVAIAMLAYGQYIALLFLERFKNKSASGER